MIMLADKCSAAYCLSEDAKWGSPVMRKIKGGEEV